MNQEDTIDLSEVFTQTEAETLIFSFLRGRELTATTAEEIGATDEEVEDFLNACLAAKMLSYSIDLAARGRLYPFWDRKAREFKFIPRE